MESTYLVGYAFYQITFTVVLCSLSFFFLNYVVCLAVVYTVYKATRLCWLEQSERFECDGHGIIITGCDSGFGYKFAKHLHDLGFTVFAGCLHVTSEGALLLQSTCSKRLHVVPLDVTSDRDVKSAREYVEQHLPNRGLWAIVNNAGMNYYGAVEFLTVTRFHRLLNINLWGYVRLTKAFLPLVRTTKGRIVMVSSVHGRFHWPNMAAYEVSKVGIETISDSLRLEMTKFGVKVIILEPGSFAHATSIKDVNQVDMFKKEILGIWNDTPKHIKDAYGKSHVMSWVPEAMGGMESGGDSRPVVRAVEHAVTSGNPRTRYLVPGTAARVDHMAMLAVFTRLLPTWVTDKYITYKTGCGQFH